MCVLTSQSWRPWDKPRPRPLKYPCQICHLACKWGQCAVRCDSCLLWYHKDCMLMNTGVYGYLNTTEASWICCNCGLPNFDSSLFSNHDFTHSNPFSPLERSEISTDQLSDFPVATSSPKDKTNHSTSSRSSWHLPDLLEVFQLRQVAIVRQIRH